MLPHSLLKNMGYAADSGRGVIPQLGLIVKKQFRESHIHNHPLAVAHHTGSGVDLFNDIGYLNPFRSSRLDEGTSPWYLIPPYLGKTFVVLYIQQQLVLKMWLVTPH